MKELVQFLAQQLVNNPEAVEVKETQGDTASVLELPSQTLSSTGTVIGDEIEIALGQVGKTGQA